ELPSALCGFHAEVRRTFFLLKTVPALAGFFVLTKGHETRRDPRAVRVGNPTPRDQIPYFFR
ncbi:MAG: hypothetical protein ACP5DC_11605, partial [Halothiobacillaceae bacterium]